MGGAWIIAVVTALFGGRPAMICGATGSLAVLVPGTVQAEHGRRGRKRRREGNPLFHRVFHRCSSFFQGFYVLFHGFLMFSMAFSAFLADFLSSFMVFHGFWMILMRHELFSCVRAAWRSKEGAALLRGA